MHHDATASYPGFLGGVHQMVGGPIFGGRNKILLLGRALKFWVSFLNDALKLKEILKIIEKI